MRLENRVAIITGASSGIGKETAMLFCQEGAKVAVTARSVERLGQLCREIDKSGAKTLYMRGDVANRDDMREVVSRTINTFGKVDILINNAGITQDALVTKMTKEQWDKVISVDLSGAFNCIQEVVPHMIEQGSGVILNASSVSGIYGNIGQTNYSAAKAGLIGMTKTLAKELGRKGIRVNAVAPGFIKTPMTEKVPDKILSMLIERTPLRRMGEASDVAYAYLYLASDEARFINGAVLHVDGGLVL
ncbi:MAG: 3-oxoacyl-ACP reductase FabG [Candidatus Methanoperedens sp.]|nr:3-oxoacyl-ACP reductase FabG [Candidatus Methanoperedens sp.]